MTNKILVIGATGPSGLCLLRELVHQKQDTIAYCRSPSKIPLDLSSSQYIQVMKGTLNDEGSLSAAIEQSRIVISLLGPSSIKQPKDTEFADYYRTIVCLMKNHNVQRILALGTTAIYQPEDQSSISRAIMSTMIKVVAGGAHYNIQAIQKFFEEKKSEVDFTVYRVGNLSGSSDDKAWEVDRSGDVYEGPVGGPGFTSGINRSVLAKWLVGVAMDASGKWVGRMPAVSNRGK
ncbi:hypothetical protein CFIMG_007528RA00001 [Ceratocystis fimbriata CBS 114723]|uniref:NAD(P)-binding domain-containing protein n=1 Tax=Ceratocystis fimbriata CBS 114723 TaxID=1035309 RepID=A0A2C5W9D9_9PEZI|nr:hypothetical protein CFIMG_007528RA00001 [Ceratocystis fimbriata CBS 114723]